MGLPAPSQNASVKDFVDLKNKIRNAQSGDLTITMSEKLSLSSATREEAKQNYFRARYEAEEAERRAKEAEQRMQEAQKQMEALNALGTLYMLGW